MHIFINRRRFLKATGLSAVSLLLASCGSGSTVGFDQNDAVSSESTSSASQSDKLTFNENWTHLYPPKNTQSFLGDVSFDIYLDETDPDPGQRPRILVIHGSGRMGDLSYYKYSPWYDFGGDITHILVEEGVTRIGNYAFREFYHLKEVQLPNSLTEIGYEAFASCNNLTKITIPESVAIIEYGAFSEVPLSEVTLSRNCSFTDYLDSPSSDFCNAFPNGSVDVNYY